MNRSSCRFCGAGLDHVFADLGVSPLANSYVTPERRWGMEPFFPLCAKVCPRCFLVQLEDYGAAPEDIFTDYAYFSSYSTSWLDHSERFATAMIERLRIGSESRVVEVASNDGYLLQYFLQAGVKVLGIEPAANVAAVAEKKGIRTAVRFFGEQAALDLRDQYAADLLIGNNVLAHVPNINDFVSGLRTLLKPDGVITMEFPHLMRLVDEAQFDTIYHEHFFYYSFLAVSRVFDAHDLTIFDVEELPTHGGSLRIYARHRDDGSKPIDGRVHQLVERETQAGYGSLAIYTNFSERVKQEKRSILSFLLDAKREGRTIVGYGAPAKGNTLLNFCGIGKDFLDYTVDRNPRKQGTYLPGSRIPILEPAEIERTRPDFLFILPWNLKDEIMGQMQGIRDWGGRFIARSPQLTVYP